MKCQEAMSQGKKGLVALVCGLSALLLCGTAESQTISLQFDSLPSAQGWTYDSDGAPETSIFSVSGGVLVQNTVPYPWSFEVYEAMGAVNPLLPFSISVRARVLQDSGTPGNDAGFCFTAHTGTDMFLIGLSTNRIEDALNNDLSTTIDNTTFHDYLLNGVSGVGYEFFVDGVLVGTGPPRPDPRPARVALGDCTRGRGAYAKITRYVFTQVLPVEIDIKPGSDPNSINLSSAGSIPVAILSSTDFDATTVEPESVSLAGARVKLVGKSGKYLCHPEDTNGDGLLDLVCQVYTAQFMIEEGESVAVLEAETLAGVPIRGEDSIRVVPD